MGHLTPVVFPPGASPDTCVPNQKTQQDFLDLFDRLLPISYVQPLKEPGPGYEILQAFGQLLARVSLAVGRVECGAFITTSFGGVRSSGLVQFFRPSATAGAVTVKAGTIVTAPRFGTDFVTLSDAVFGALDVGPVSVVARAIAAGWEWDVRGERTTGDGTVLAGEIDTVKLPIQDPPFGDASIDVRQVDDMTGGQAAMLDQLGEDRGVSRAAAEGDNPYRARVRGLPDTVSPDAIIRAVVDYLSQIGAGFTLVETPSVEYQTCWDGPGAAIDDYDPNLFCYDDPRPNPPFRNRWLSENDYRGAFFILVPNIAAIEDVGMGYDDTATTPAGHVSPSTGGRRGYAAYDVPPTVDPVLILAGGYDGFDLKKQAVYKGLFDLLQDIKAAGVSATVELEGE